jgi:hypothetical protein
MQTTTAANVQETKKGRVPRSVMTLFILLLMVCTAAAKELQLKPTPPVPPVQKTAVQLQIGGVASDKIICFEMKLNSVVATATNGKTTSLVSSPITVEIMHWAGDSETVEIDQLPHGTYSQVSIAATATRTTSLDPVSGLLVIKPLSKSFTSVIHFNPTLTVGTTPVALSLQISPDSVVNSSAIGGSATQNSAAMLRVTASRIGVPLPQTKKVKVQRTVGSVTAVSASSFTVMDGQTGASLTFAVNSATQFRNATLSTLSGLIVAVRGKSATNGLLEAVKVEALENRNGVVMEGIFSGYIPNSDVITLASQDGAGVGMKSAIVGSGVSVDLSENPKYVVDTDDMDMTGMASLEFDSSSLVLGQHVQVQSLRGTRGDTHGNSALMSPETVTLEPQTLTGTVANYQAGETPGTATFDLVFATNAQYNVINPFFYTMHVYQQAGTSMQTAISNGAAVHIWGLVFFSQLPENGGGASIKEAGHRAARLFGRSQNQPTFLMVAGRITN